MKKSLLLFFLLALLGSCDRGGLTHAPANAPKAQLDGPAIERDWSQIQEDGVLKAIMIYSSTTYFLYRGEAMGFEYEMLKRMAKDLGLDLEVIVANNIDEVFDLLNSGQGDVIAYGLTITEERKKLIEFTDYLYLTHQALVQRKPKNWRRMPRHRIAKELAQDVIELIGDTVHVHRRSSYYERLINLQEEIGGKIHIDTIVGNYNIEDVIQMVVDGEIKYTLADHNLAAINATYHPILDVNTPVSLSQRIAWGVRKNSPKLLDTINHWIENTRKKEFYHFVYDKYYVHKKTQTRRVKSDFYSKTSGMISPYDSLIQRYADSIGWDWRLLASQVYQESRFNPQSESWAGAQGLMQIMPNTAADLGVSNPSDPHQSLAAGTRYLRGIYDKFENIPDSIQRLKFTLAAYNCGYGHLLDAQRLAAEAGKDSLVYDNSTDYYLRKLGEYRYYSKPRVRYGPVRGEEPYRYVRDIFLRSNHYANLLPDSLGLP